jgi:hypothetical protein
MIGRHQHKEFKMTINYIDVGIIANDGTGDDLREAFIKVNDNFEELDLRIVEETVIDNAGSLGAGIYSGKINGENLFKRLLAGSNITLNENANTITINANDSLDQLIVISDNGTVTISRGQTLSIQGGQGISTRVDGQQLVVNLDDNGIVVKDLTPILGGNLNANNRSILNANTISATTFSGNLEGNVYGINIQPFISAFDGFDFGEFQAVYTNSLDFIMRKVDVDFGPFDPPSGDSVDLGGF